MKVEDLETKHEYDWNGLIEDIKKYGTRNSLLTALMPTATTSQIMKYSECFEPYMSNIFTRSTIAGEFIVINENLINNLEKHNLWNKDMREKILENKGSIQNINKIPQNIKDIFKTGGL
jgi:ribonucleotide reductase alpha subunit